jgi:hypothetical protein
VVNPVENTIIASNSWLRKTPLLQATKPQLGRTSRTGNLKMRGTNLGGFLVLEPWITPSMFYQFLGVTEPSKVGMDMFTFCKALGDVSVHIYIYIYLWLMHI